MQHTSIEPARLLEILGIQPLDFLVGFNKLKVSNTDSSVEILNMFAEKIYGATKQEIDEMYQFRSDIKRNWTCSVRFRGNDLGSYTSLIKEGAKGIAAKKALRSLRHPPIYSKKLLLQVPPPHSLDRIKELFYFIQKNSRYADHLKANCVQVEDSIECELSFRGFTLFKKMGSLRNLMVHVNDFYKKEVEEDMRFEAYWTLYDQIKKAFDLLSPETAVSLSKPLVVFKQLHHISEPELKIEKGESLNQSVQKEVQISAHKLEKSASIISINKDTISIILRYINPRRAAWIKEAENANENLYIHSSFELPRSVQCDVGGSSYIHFTRSKKHGADKLIGKGSYKVLKFAVELETGNLFASASMTRATGLLLLEKFELVKGVEGVIQLHSYVHYISHGVEKTRILMPYIKGEDLRKALKNHSLNYNQKIEIAMQLLNTLSNLHAKGIIHRDIKLENICLDENKCPTIIDIDFCCVEGDDFNVANCGTRHYLSPEFAKASLGLIAPQSANRTKHDVWAMGVVLHLMFISNSHVLSNIPWFKDFPVDQNTDLVQRTGSLGTVCIKSILPEPEDTNSIEHLIWEMLRPDPNERIPASDALIKLIQVKMKLKGAEEVVQEKSIVPMNKEMEQIKKTAASEKCVIS